jgi:hypothetical protein
MTTKQRAIVFECIITASLFILIVLAGVGLATVLAKFTEGTDVRISDQKEPAGGD